jgi:hypothetical protein
MRAPLEQKRSALKALLRAAGDGKIQATALAYENVKAYLDDPYAGEPIDIPPTHWAYLKLDPSGRPILLGPGGRVYRDVQFRRLSVKEQWPPLSVEPIESGTVVALSESPEPEPERIEASEPEPERVEEALPESAGPTEPKAGPQWERAERYIKKHFPHDEKLTYDRVGYGNLFNAITLGVHDGVVTLGGHARTDVDKDSAMALVAEHRIGLAVELVRLLGRVVAQLPDHQLRKGYGLLLALQLGRLHTQLRQQGDFHHGKPCRRALPKSGPSARLSVVEAGRLFDRALSDSASDPSVRWSAHEGLARVALASRRTADATRHFEVALQTIEKTRSDLMKTEYRLSYLTRLISFYREFVVTHHTPPS